MTADQFQDFELGGLKSVMRIIFAKRFVDSRSGKLYGPGVEYDMSDNDARRLHADGRGRIQDENVAAAMDAAVAAQGRTPATRPPLGTGQAPSDLTEFDKGDGPAVVTKAPATDLPEGFPSRDLLIENGFDSVEKLRVKGVERELEHIKGIGKAAITKIGVALSEFD